MLPLAILAVLTTLLILGVGVTHTLTRSWTNGAVNLTFVKPVTADLEIDFDCAMADATVNQLFTVAIPVAKLQSLFIQWVQAADGVTPVAGTLKTNSSGSPVDTLTFAAGGAPLIWDASSPIAKPLTTAVTALYLSPTLAAASILRVRATYNF